MVPIYGANAEAEIVMGLAFANGYPKDAHLTTKCMLGATDPAQIAARLTASLAASIDRAVKPHSAEQRDYDRAAGFRAIAAELGIPAAILAHRYALSMDGVDTLILEVKNRQELQDCLAAEAAPNLDPPLMRRIEAAVSSTAENPR